MAKIKLRLVKLIVWLLLWPEAKVLVTHGQVMQAADHDFSSITVTPTVVLMNDIPEKIGDSWQTWAPHKFFICQNCNHCAL